MESDRARGGAGQAAETTSDASIREPGTVFRLWRYPVKSMLGEECGRLDVDRRGVEGDRLFAVRDRDGKLGSGKTTRRFCRMDGLFGLRAEYRQGEPTVVWPDGRRYGGSDPDVHAALSEALGQPVTLARESGIPHLDAGPIHILTTASLAWLRAWLPDARLDERRFRPNVLVDVRGDIEAERSWAGRTVSIGDQVRLRVTSPTERCRMVGLAQSDLPDDPGILRGIARHGEAHFGVYAEVLIPGRIQRGDILRVDP